MHFYIRMALRALRLSTVSLLCALVFSCSNKEAGSPADKAESKSTVQQIHEYMENAVEEDSFNGVVLIAKDEDIVFQEAYGYVDFRTKEALKVDTPFCLASVSKQFTAMAIMILQERGQLSYSDSLSSFFPGFPSYANDITVEHLLTHTAGIVGYSQLDIYNRPDITNEDVLELLIDRKSLDFKPGKRHVYRNTGYILLALIVEKVSGQSFATFLKENIFDPLAMENSLVYDLVNSELPGRAVGFKLSGRLDDYRTQTKGSGSIFGSATDLYKWHQALNSGKLVNAETMDKAFSPHVLNNGSKSYYGYGWILDESGKNRFVYHAGTYGGYRTIIYRHLHRNTCLIILSNNGNDSALTELPMGISKILQKET